MPVPTTLKALDFSNASAVVNRGGAFVDVRPLDGYLDVHIPGSIALEYDNGPGMQSRARDCIPLDIPLVLLDLESEDPAYVAALLRGKGFDVVGKVDDGINQWAKWHGSPASTETHTGESPPSGAHVLHVGDPGARAPQGAATIPIESLWRRVGEVPSDRPVCVVAGYGLRAGVAVGILERAGVADVVFWRTRQQQHR